MKLVIALAASAQAFVGPTARLPAGRVGHVTKVQQQPKMLLGGLRARANNLVPRGVRPPGCLQHNPGA
jgi:hypothetical protein